MTKGGERPTPNPSRTGGEVDMTKGGGECKNE